MSAAVAHAHSEIDAVADASVWSMTLDETTQTLVELTRLKSRLAELELRVVDHADATPSTGGLAPPSRPGRPSAARRSSPPR